MDLEPPVEFLLRNAFQPLHHARVAADHHQFRLYLVGITLGVVAVLLFLLAYAGR